MKKLVFVMAAVLSLMFVSCNTTPASTTSSSSDSLIVEVDSTKAGDSIKAVDSVKTKVPGTAEVQKPSKPENKENVDVTTPAKPTEEANKPIGNKK